MNQKLYKLFKMLAKFETVSTVDNLTLELPNGLNVDSEVFVENEEGELVPIQDGEYQVGDITIVVVGGVIAEIKQADINEPETIVEEPETVVTEMQEEPTEPTTEEPETNTEVEELKQKIADLEAEKAELEAKIADLEAKLSEPIEEPIEDVFKAVEPKNEPKIDFSKYINRNK